MNNRGEILLVLMIAMMVFTAGISTTKWNTGFEKSIYVENDLPDVELYYSITGLEDKVWWDMQTVQDRARQLADIYGYEGDDIACNSTGDRLYIIGD